MASASNKSAAHPNYVQEKKLLRTFLTDFLSSADDRRRDASLDNEEEEQKMSDEDGPSKPVYLRQLQAIVDSRSTVLTVHLDDVSRYFEDPAVQAAAAALGSQQEVAEMPRRIESNTLRYLALFYKAADRVLKTLAPSDQAMPALNLDGAIYSRQRSARYRQLNGPDAVLPEDLDSDDESPENMLQVRQSQPLRELARLYEIVLAPSTQLKQSPQSMRSIQASQVGSLVSLRGLITRVSDVAPLMRVVTYICTTCGFESYQSLTNDRTFTPLKMCPSQVCSTNQSKGHLLIQNRACKYSKFEQVKLQELPSQVPVGRIPRSCNLRVYGELTRILLPGDDCTVTGVYLPTPSTGFRAMRAGLTADTYIHVLHVSKTKQSYRQMDINMTNEMKQACINLSQQPDCFSQLALSIAPEIYGHVDIKKAMLLLLVAGVSQVCKDGVKIRGDLNLLLMGDPGVAKSQLLKQVTSIAPRGVYTSGKGSSGVGLTAAVIRDPITQQMSLEGGSLVMADQGICCIDEFDKMSEADRTAIHEVMEQQTVSIAKAGMTTTLNARTAVIAAANPVFGRFNPSKSVEDNLGLPTSLLSRFDLQFMILDVPDRDLDEKLAQHVTYVHRHLTQPPSTSAHEPLSPAFLREYIALAKTYTPKIQPSLMDEIVSHYTSMRTLSAEQGGNRSSTANQRQGFITPRALLSILRLAQAHARVHLRSLVISADVQAAIALMQASQRSLSKDNAGEGREAQARDPMSTIYTRIIAEFRARRATAIDRLEMRRLIIALGFSEIEFEACLNEYERLNVWTMTSKQLHLISVEELGSSQGDAEDDDAERESMEY